jgi:hypothetical protein
MEVERLQEELRRRDEEDRRRDEETRRLQEVQRQQEQFMRQQQEYWANTIAQQQAVITVSMKSQYLAFVSLAKLNIGALHFAVNVSYPCLPGSKAATTTVTVGNVSSGAASCTSG